MMSIYAFELELNVFDLFETKAELELTRSKKDGSLLPNTLYFYVKASPGIPLIPPIPVGQLNGGGAGFMDLAKTVNGDYRGHSAHQAARHADGHLSPPHRGHGGCGDRPK